MRKWRKGKRYISPTLASKLYHEGGSLRQVGEVFKLDNGGLFRRFIKYGIELRTKSEAIKGKKYPSGPANKNWKGGYHEDQKGYIVNSKTKNRLHQEMIRRQRRSNEK
jgi:hypothetical protein